MLTEKTIESEARATARIVLVPLSPCGSVLLSLVNAIDVLELCGLAEHNTHATVARLSELDCPFHRLRADMVTSDDVLCRNLHEYQGVNCCPYTLDVYFVVRHVFLLLLQDGDDADARATCQARQKQFHGTGARVMLTIEDDCVAGTCRDIERLASTICRLDFHCLCHDINNPFLFLCYGGFDSIIKLRKTSNLFQPGLSPGTLHRRPGLVTASHQFLCRGASTQLSSLERRPPIAQSLYLRYDPNR